MTDNREWIINRLDWYFSVSEMVIEYFKNHTTASFDIAKETWKITKSQLQLFLRDHKADIYLDDALYNYYECISKNFEFIDSNLTTTGGHYYEENNHNDCTFTSSNRNPSSSCSDAGTGIISRLHRMVTSRWRR